MKDEEKGVKREKLSLPGKVKRARNQQTKKKGKKEGSIKINY